MRNRIALLLAIVAGTCYANSQQSLNCNVPPATLDPYIQSIIAPFSGYWMLDYAGQVAHWLGEEQGGKCTIEPINAIFVITAEDAQKASIIVNQEIESAGFHMGILHTTGFKAYINGNLDFQYAGGVSCIESGMYFSRCTYVRNNVSESGIITDNDHFRLFGPEKVGNDYVFIGSCSQETGSGYMGEEGLLTHHFKSFNHCRDVLRDGLKYKGGFTPVYMEMGNTYDDGIFTTRDHEGAVLFYSNSN